MHEMEEEPCVVVEDAATEVGTVAGIEQTVQTSTVSLTLIWSTGE